MRVGRAAAYSGPKLRGSDAQIYSKAAAARLATALAQLASARQYGPGRPATARIRLPRNGRAGWRARRPGWAPACRYPPRAPNHRRRSAAGSARTVRRPNPKTPALWATAAGFADTAAIWAPNAASIAAALRSIRRPASAAAP